MLHLELNLVVDIYRSLKVNMDDDWQPTVLYFVEVLLLIIETRPACLLIDRYYTSHDLLPTFLNLIFSPNFFSSFFSWLTVS